MTLKQDISRLKDYIHNIGAMQAHTLYYGNAPPYHSGNGPILSRNPTALRTVFAAPQTEWGSIGK